MGARRSTIVAVAVSAACALVLSACLITRSSSSQVVTAPEAGATSFGTAFSMDESRLVARAVRAGRPVVYVYDLAGSGWVHSATITAPAAATERWGWSLAVSGDEIAVADPWRPGFETEEYGVVTLYRRSGALWTEAQNIFSGREWTNFAAGVWLSGRGMVVRSDVVCDSTCSAGSWTLYHRYGTTYDEVFRTRPGAELSVGVDDGVFAVGNPSRFDIDTTSYDNALRVIDADVTLPRFLLDEVVPIGDPFGTEPLVTDLFRQVDVSGDVLAYESCCTSDDRLHIRRFDGVSYQPEATFPLDEQSESVSVLPGLVLVADADLGVWHTYVHHDGEWKRSNDVPAPTPAAGQFTTPPVAAGDKIAVSGGGAIHVMTLEVVEVDLS